MIRLVDIAEAAGVTPGAVSNALTGRGRVSDETRDRIRRIAGEMGYLPNPAARMLKSKHLTDVGILLVDYTYIMIGPLLTALETCGLRSQIECCPSDAKTLPSIFAPGYAKGIITVGAYPDVIREFIKNKPEYPLVSIWEKSPYCVYSDFYSGTIRAIEAFLAREKRRIAFFLTDSPFEEHRQMARAVEDCVKKFNLDFSNSFSNFSSTSWQQTVSPEEYIRWVNHVLDKESLPMAFFCSGIISARLTIYAALKRNLQIPGDVAIIATGWPRDSMETYPQVTTLEQQLDKVASEAVAILQRRIGKLPIAEKQELIDVKLIFRQTTEE